MEGRRLTMRELQGRRRRAEEGWIRFQAAQLGMAETNTRMRETAGCHVLMDPHGDPAWHRTKEQTQRDMKAAIEMMREGLPHNTLEVGGRLFVLQNRRL